MNFVTHFMDARTATEVAGWSYQPPYDFYNMDVNEESMAELLNGSYQVVASTEGQTIGFYCLGESAQVPTGHKLGAYDYTGSVVDIGIGLRPDLTGQGFGASFFSYVLEDVSTRHPSAALRLTVATFNKRAIRLYEQFGFSYQTLFESNDVAFQTMLKEKG
ncbi:MAG: hypothetical protein A2201_00770 [Alicyclobacillus sp. RIFOXYA1_FULL_53_8]|nr:MAG: hypothetical protein A2201_00770 [Alicyclobacillus sp. RIFOXYA1_FULL_53_8]